jgi:signal transduction histidine kinase
MDAPFLCGVLVAWAIAQVALGAFFSLAHVLGRREQEYRLFGLLCFSLALTTAGIAWAHAGGSVDDWYSAASLSHAGAILAAALNLHFVMRYAEVRGSSHIALAAYTLGSAYEALNLLGLWWRSDSVHQRHAQVLGFDITHFSASPTAVASTFYGVVAVELATSFAFLFVAFRSGKREALWSLFAALLVGVAVCNDILLLTGFLPDTLYLLPHTFLIYAFAVATTLLVRYRVATGQLEETATSLRQRTEELRHSHLEIRLMQDELVRKKQLAAVGELSAAIAHEVRNPLAIIVNAVAGLRRAQVSEGDRTTLLDIVDEETARLNRLVTDLLRFARPVQVKRASVNLQELAERARMVTKHDCDVQVDPIVDPNLDIVTADPGLMRLVFDNLVANACQAMPTGGVVHVRVRRGDIEGSPAVCIDIVDTGHGMDPQVLTRATDPFFTTRPSGTGLGLPIVERIIEAHGGRVDIDSEQGRGTTVTLVLPLQDAADVENHELVRARSSKALS